MKTRIRKLVALALVFAMLLTVMPAQAFAVERARWFGDSLEQAQSVSIEEPVEEIKSPAIVEELAIDDELTVSIDAEEGAFPEGTEVAAEKVELADVQKAVDEAEDVDGTVLYAVDITFTKDGEELQPVEGKTVKVSFSAPELKDKAENAAVVHIDDETKKAEPIETVDAEKEDEVVFKGEKFSIYAVIKPGSGEEARVEVNFINLHLDGATEKTEANTVATVYVKNDDDDNPDGRDMIKKIVYDPGIKETLPAGYLFRGWTIEAADANTGEGAGSNYGRNYDINTKVYNIEGIQNYLNNLAKANSIKEGDVLNIYAIILKTYTVTYVEYDEGQEVILGSNSVPLSLNETTTGYEVNMGVNKKPTEKFFGWKPIENPGNIKVGDETATTSTIIPNKTQVTLQGDVKLTSEVKDGAWLIFDENGKGATYCAPQFVEPDDVTKQPRPDAQMTRNGYTFDGWYTEAEGGSKFTFGQALTENKTIYAHWTANTTASYTVIFWLENLDGDDYDLKTSYHNTGTVGQPIPYTFVENGDEDWANGYGEEGHYTGFCLQHDVESGLPCNKTGAAIEAMPVITPEGDATLNLYYERITYEFKFYLYRQAGTVPYVYTEHTGDGTEDGEYYRNTNGDRVYWVNGRWYRNQNGTNAYNGTVYTRTEGSFTPSGNGDRYDYANNSGSGSELNNLVTWHENQTAHPNATGYNIDYDFVGGYAYYYFTISAKYEEDISGKWPTYDKVTGANGREMVSYVMMVGTKLKPNPTNQGSGTVKGIITVMNENILGATNDADGNYVIIRFPDSFYNWRYHIWYETVEGEDYTGKTLHEYNGKTYYEDTTLVVRSSNTTDGNQNEPKYQGYDYITRVGQNNQGVWGGEHWTTQDGNTTLYHLNYIYDRQIYDINFMDGLYVGGSQNNEEKANHSTLELNIVRNIPYGLDVSGYSSYKPEKSNEVGFVFEGWYTDPSCQAKYKFTTMPLNGITVYAKWIQIQYRVFLHPNASTEETVEGAVVTVRDNTLSWGKNEQGVEITPEMNFRVSYQEFISAPTGTRDGYEFGGWYTDDGSFNDYFDAEYIPLTDEVVTAAYDMEDPKNYTDKMDKWGLVYDEYRNSDLTGDNGSKRFWITKKLDLYAKWSEVVVGAKGINVEYDPNGGSPKPTDEAIYEESSKAYAQAAPTTPPDPVEGKKQQFKCWHVMKWNGTDYDDTGVKVLPGDTFTVLKANAKITDDNNSNAVVKPEDVDVNGHYTYTVLLRAEYGPIDEPKPTFINWYRNWADTDTAKTSVDDPTNGGITHQDPKLQINKGIDIYGTPERFGYNFLGWARKDEKESEESEEIHTYYGGLTENDLYLKWVPATQATEGTRAEAVPAHYEAEYNGSWVEVSQVAADDQSPYQAFYAVWEPKKFNVVYTTDGTVEGDAGKDVKLTLNIPDYVKGSNSASIDLTELKDEEENVYLDGYLYGGYYTLDAEGKTVWGGANTVKSVTPEENETYYVRRIHNNYLLPYYKLLYYKAYKKVTDLWLMSCVDDENVYKATGYIITPIEPENPTEANEGVLVDGYSYGENVITLSSPLYTSVTVTNADNGTSTVAPANVSGHTEGYLSCVRLDYDTDPKYADELGYAFINLDVAKDANNKKNITFEATPYWITQDDVVVCGRLTYIIEVHPDSGGTVSKSKKDSSITDEVKASVLKEYKDAQGTN